MIALLPVAAACGSSSGSAKPAASSPASSASSTATGTPAASEPVIEIKNFQYTVPSTVAPGSTVQVKNTDNVSHTVTADGAGGFDDQATAGKTTSFTAPSKPGRYAFHCSFHGNMHGVLVVQ